MAVELRVEFLQLTADSDSTLSTNTITTFSLLFFQNGVDFPILERVYLISFGEYPRNSRVSQDAIPLENLQEPKMDPPN